jgi:hypothetical protein
MTGKRSQAAKYLDLKNNYSLTRAMLAEHLAGRETYATTLAAAGTAWAGCKDYDAASDAEIIAAQDSATARGITTVAFLMPGKPGEHCGGHLWTFYNRPYAESDILAQLRTIPRKGKGEDYPSGNPIRLPFGVHKVKKTRGVMRLPDGRRFRLDIPAELAAGLEAFFALPLNGKPTPAEPGDARTSSGAAWGDAYKSEEWKNLPAGGPLWRSPYIARSASTRPDLAKLVRGERVTLIRDNTPDDSDSAQVAALAYNLRSADVDRAQAFGVADYLHQTLRPNKSIEHYRAHFAAEWERYKPAYYTGRVIRILGPEDGDAPSALPEAQHKAPRKSRARKDRPQRVAGAAGYLEWLRGQVDAQTDSVPLSQRQCAERLRCNVRTIKRYEQQLGDTIERRVYARRQAGCLFIAPDVVPTSLADVVIADVVIAHQDAANKQQPPTQVEHPAPLAPSPAAPDPEPEPDAWAGIEDEIAAWEASDEGQRAQERAAGHRRPARGIGRAEWAAIRARGKALIAELGLPAEAPPPLPPGWGAITARKQASGDLRSITRPPRPAERGATGGECSPPSGSGPPDAASLVDRLKQARDLRQEASGYD